MTLCEGRGTSHRHDEVCYESGDCPACAALDERDALADELAQAKSRIDDLESRLDDAGEVNMGEDA